MSGESHTTTDHEAIRKWAEARDGQPATVENTGRGGEEAGILRIAFADTEETALEPIDWDTFFDKFEEENLAFLYQDETREGKPSRFFKFVARE